MHGQAVIRGNPAAGKSRLPAVLSLLIGLGLPLAVWLLTAGLRQDPLAGLRPDSPTGWTVMLLFQPEECPGRMAVVDRLNQASGRSLLVRGVMVVDSVRFRDWRRVAIANEFRFPVLPLARKRAAQVRHALGGIATPSVLVFDRSGRLHLATDLGDGSWLDPFLRDLELRAAHENLRRKAGPG